MCHVIVFMTYEHHCPVSLLSRSSVAMMRTCCGDCYSRTVDFRDPSPREAMCVCVLGRKRFASGGGPRGENILINDLTLPKCFLAISEEASLKAYLE
jgi:hypothetical protein